MGTRRGGRESFSPARTRARIRERVRFLLPFSFSLSTSLTRVHACVRGGNGSPLSLSFSSFLLSLPSPFCTISLFFRFVCVRERNKEGRGKDTGRQGQSWKLSTSNFFRNFLRSLCPLVQFPQTRFYIHVQVPEKFVIRVLLGHVDPRGDFEALDLGILEDFLGEGGLSEAAHEKSQ